MLTFDDLQQSTPYRFVLHAGDRRFSIVGYFGKFELFGRGLPMSLEVVVSEVAGDVLRKREVWWIPASNAEAIEAMESSYERNNS